MNERPADILVVDDDPFNRELVAASLADRPYIIRFAGDGREALAAVQRQRPDAIVLDLMMPEVDGFQVLARLREDERWSTIPVIVVTSISARREHLHAIELGAFDFLTKPIDAEATALRVHNAVAFRRAHVALQRSFEAQRRLQQQRADLSHMLVHDIRSPLTALVGFLHLLELDAGPKLAQHERAHLEIARASANSITAMLDEFLEIQRLEDGALRLALVDCELVEFVRATVESMRPLAGARRVSVSTSCDVISARCDLAIVGRVITNLLGNAFKYTPEDAVVGVALAETDDGFTVAVEDDGPGIPLDQQARIFEKFRRASDRSGGHGLGLAYCRLAAEAHGGRITVMSSPGRGSRFELALPKTPG